MDEKRKQYMKDYWEKNREKLLAKQRERNKVHYAENPEKYAAKGKAWKEANPERMRELQKKHQQENRETINQRSSDWYQANKPRAASQSRQQKLKRYGLTSEQYQALLAQQNGGCAICQATQGLESKNHPLYVDHDHQTGQVRGLLCQRCNAGLGMFKDSLELVTGAAAYLTKSLSGATSMTNKRQ